MTRTRNVLAIAAVATLGLLTACGDDSTAKPADTTAAEGGSSDTAASGDTTPADTASGDSTGGASSGAGVGSEFCNYQTELNNMDTPFDNADAGPAEYQQFFEQTVADAVAQMRDSAPDEIADEVEILAAGLEKVGAAFAKVGYDPAKAQTDPDVLALFQDQAYNDAGATVDAFCGFSS